MWCSTSLNVPINFTNGSREITPSFTQEWPVFSQTHQFSYTIPYAFTEDDNGMEDMRLNYRLQALTEGERTPAFAPRFSLVLPTGDPDKDLGVGSVGYETNLPFSKIVSDRWTLNFNAGHVSISQCAEPRPYELQCWRQRHLRREPRSESHVRDGRRMERRY